MINRNLPYVFVTIQFACIVVLAATGPLVAGTDWGIMLEFAGIFLGVLAIYQNESREFQRDTRSKNRRNHGNTRHLQIPPSSDVSRSTDGICTINFGALFAFSIDCMDRPADELGV